MIFGLIALLFVTLFIPIFALVLIKNFLKSLVGGSDYENKKDGTV